MCTWCANRRIGTRPVAVTRSPPYQGPLAIECTFISGATTDEALFDLRAPLHVHPLCLGCAFLLLSSNSNSQSLLSLAFSAHNLGGRASRSEVQSSPHASEMMEQALGYVLELPTSITRNPLRCLPWQPWQLASTGCIRHAHPERRGSPAQVFRSLLPAYLPLPRQSRPYTELAQSSDKLHRRL